MQVRKQRERELLWVKPELRTEWAKIRVTHDVLLDVKTIRGIWDMGKHWGLNTLQLSWDKLHLVTMPCPLSILLEWAC